MDFFDRTDFSISDGLTSITSNSGNLGRLETLVADVGVVASLSVAVLGGTLPLHISNMSSRFLMRSSNDGLVPISESLEFELNDGATHGLSGGCSIGGCAVGFWSRLAVSTGLIFGSAGGGA